MPAQAIPLQLFTSLATIEIEWIRVGERKGLDFLRAVLSAWTTASVSRSIHLAISVRPPEYQSMAHWSASTRDEFLVFMAHIGQLTEEYCSGLSFSYDSSFSEHHTINATKRRRAFHNYHPLYLGVSEGFRKQDAARPDFRHWSTLSYSVAGRTACSRSPS